MSVAFSSTTTIAILMLVGAPFLLACHALQTTISTVAAQEAADHEVMERALEVMNDPTLTRQERAEVISRSLSR